MLSNLFKKRKLQVWAPMSGEVLPLEKVPDPIFSEKMMGEGVAIMPEGGNVHSPIEGEVIMVAETRHAIGLRAEDGTEILIHIGLETVSLKGQGFKVLVCVGEKISARQKIMEVDWHYLKENVQSILTPIVVTNNASAKEIRLGIEKNCILGETVLMQVSTRKA